MAERITGHTELIGLIATPIRHSMSPTMHNEAFAHLGLDYVYLAFEVGNQELKDVVQGFRAMKLRGFNVSMPNKTEICQYLDKLSPAAQLVGAVNTVVNDDGVLTGHITDGTGYMRALSEAGIDIISKKMTVLGAGGAATALCVQAALDGVKAISIFNRRDKFFANAEETVAKIRHNTDCEIHLFDLDDHDKLRAEIDSSVILTNATGVGMKPFEGQMLLPDDSFLRPDLIVSDVVYNPRKTHLLEVAEKKGCRTLNGLGMMLWQGARAFEIWTGKQLITSRAFCSKRRMMKNKYIPTAAGLYLNYLIHGMGVLLITLNMAHLQEQWGTDKAGVSIVISSLGIGKLATIVTGFLSDRFGRKPFIYLGILSYLIFFVGILLTKNIYLAYVFGIMAGLANSFLDSGTYPALMESFPHSASRANVLIKAFVSAGQFLLPFIISFLIWANLWFGWSFVIAAALFVLSGIYLLKMPFPDSQAAKKEEAPTAQAETAVQPQANKLDMVIFTLYGYIGMATFYLVSQWLAQYGQFVVGLPYASAIKLLSIYTVGSLVCVFVTAAFVKEVFSSAIAMIIYTGLSMISLLLVCLFPTPMMVTGFAFVIGFAAAGGVLQLGATIMAMSFPNGKGKATGIFYTAGSIASFTIPLITAKLSQISIASIMWFDFLIAVIGFVIALYIGYRQLQARAAQKVSRTAVTA